MKNRLSSHIDYILSIHGCAVVPNLGGFVREMIPARYDNKAHLAYPPQAQVCFQEALSHHDGLLVERYAIANKISLRRAKLLVEQDVRELKQELVHNKRVTLEKIGTLALSREHKLSFTPQSDRHYIEGSYGLAPLSIPRYKEPTGLTNHKDYFTLQIPKRATLVAASIITLICLYLLPWGRLQTNNTPSYTAGISTQVLPLPSEPLAYTEQTIPEPPTPEQKASHIIDGQSGRYYIIIATEHKEELATAHYARAVEDAIPTLGILHNGRNYRVAVLQPFDTAAQAYQALKELRSNHPQHSSAWVYEHR